MRTLLADIGNSSIKMGPMQPSVLETALQSPAWSLRLEDLRLHDVGEDPVQWYCVSVNPPAFHQLQDLLVEQRPQDRIQVVKLEDFNLRVRVTEPARLGLDRVAAAAAAVHLKSPDSAAIVIDVGTATTVDAVSADGQFLGGAILGSPSLILNALNSQTQALPRISIDALNKVPNAIGRNTSEALQSGAYWGQVGAINQLIKNYQPALGSTIEIFLCGGGSSLIAPHLDVPAGFSSGPHIVPGLVRAGLATVAKPTG